MNDVQTQLLETMKAAEALAESLYGLNQAASKEDSSAGCLMHMLVMPQLKAACEIESQVKQLNNSYNHKPE